MTLKNETIYSRTEALIGNNNLKKINKAHIAVFGIGGVGGMAAEALARSGINEISIVDHDKVKPSNLNRQILFTSSDIGKLKVKVAETRLKSINQDLTIHTYPIFFKEENIKDLPFNQYDYVIDAIDSIPCKIGLIKYLLNNKIPFISSLGMGNRLDPSKLLVTTLDKTHDDPLAKKLRNELKKEGINLKLIKVVTSNETPIKSKEIITSMIFVPSSAGLLLANYIIECIIKAKR